MLATTRIDRCFVICYLRLTVQQSWRRTAVVTGTGAQLKYSEQSTKYIGTSSGTRHTSAQRFSFDCASTIVVTVSADGPVTVFSDGINVVELTFRSADGAAKALGRMVPEKRNDIVPSSWTETCKNCGKTSVIEEVVIYGWKDREEARCPICRGELASSMCFTISAHVIKQLPPLPAKSSAPPPATEVAPELVTIRPVAD